jgi:hypothetical protein
MEEYLNALTAAATVVGGIIALAVSARNLFGQFGGGGAAGGGGAGPRVVAAAVGVVLLIVGALAFFQWREARPLYHLSIEIQDKQSRPDRILAKNVFTGIAGRQLSDDTLGEITAWITDELRAKDYELDAVPIELELRIPADASVEPIVVAPSDPRTTISYAFLRGRIADRISPTNLGPDVDTNYFIVVERPKYEPVWIAVSPGTSRVETATLAPAPIRIAVGGIDCGENPADQEDEHLAEWLQTAMVAHSRVVLYQLQDYQATAETLSMSPDSVARQEPWELDLVILGNYARV